MPVDTEFTSAFGNVCDDSRDSMLNLRAFLDKFTLSTSDRETKANFVNVAPQYRRLFYVPDSSIPQLMELLQTCYNDGVMNHLHEVQDDQAGLAGLVIDFEFLTDESKLEFECMVPLIIRVLFQTILPETIMFSDETEYHYCYYLSTPKPVFDHASQKYKSKYRIVIPSIMLDFNLRFLINHRLRMSKDIHVVFEKRLNYSYRGSLVRHSYVTPLALLGSCAADEPSPLILDSVRKIVVENGRFDGDVSTVSSVDTKMPHLVYEAAVTHVRAGGVVQKTTYCTKENAFERLEALRRNDKARFQMASDEAYAEIAQLMLVDPQVELLMEAFKMLGAYRFKTVNAWLDVIRALASAGNKYRPLAVVLSKQRMQSQLTYDDFQSHWANVVCQSEQKYTQSAHAIRYWASLDSPSQFARYMEETMRKMLIRDIRNPMVEGKINHSHMSSYLYFMFGNVYISADVNKREVHWYEYVTESHGLRDVEPGQLYKWRALGVQPDYLFSFISSKFPEIVSTVHSDLKSLRQRMLKSESSGNRNDNNDYALAYIKSLFKNFHSSVQSIYSAGFKKSAIDDSSVLFKRNHYVKQMNKDPHIMGVGNGVLEFDNEGGVRLLDSYHTYPISQYTDTKYIPYDENNEHIKVVMGVLRSLVPDDETDALDFLIYYFSTSLDWFTKESLFLIIHGGGANGKSMLLDFLRRTLGESYAKKLPLSFITDLNRTRSSSTDSAMMLLKGARLAYYSESDRNEKVNIAKVKEITGGEVLAARELFGTMENFIANCNHIVTTNHRFVIETTEWAVWRRFLSYKFKICFKHDPKTPFERKRDDELIKKLKEDKRYQEAFLSILVEYRRRLYTKYEGQILLVPHPTIKKETGEYQESENVLQRYINQNTFYYKGKKQTLDTLATNFKNFYKTESGGTFSGQTLDLVHQFRNSILLKYITEENGFYTLTNFYSVGENDPLLPGSIKFGVWMKMQEKKGDANDATNDDQDENPAQEDDEDDEDYELDAQQAGEQ